jgi:hypothetical protein
MLRRRRCGISVNPDVSRSPLGTRSSGSCQHARRITQCQHGRDQAQQRPGKVMLSDHGDIVIHADVVDDPRAAWRGSCAVHSACSSERQKAVTSGHQRLDEGFPRL